MNEYLSLALIAIDTLGGHSDISTILISYVFFKVIELVNLIKKLSTNLSLSILIVPGTSLTGQ